MAESQATILNAEVLQALAAALPEPGTSLYPLSCAQESLWFIEQMAGGTAAYNLPEAWRLKGTLDVAAVQQSLDELVSRHEILRTSIVNQEGRPRQNILSSARIELQLVDLCGAAHPERDLEDKLAAEARRPFDLSCAPLARAVLFRLSAEESMLLVNLHHIISDAWSQRVFMHELGLAYAAFAKGTPLCLPDLPVQCADFTLWQREMLQTEADRGDLAYWEEQLRGPIKKTLLPTDHPRRVVRSYQGATRFFEISPQLAGSLRELSRQEGVTLFMTLLAAFKTLLHRYTREDVIVVGSPMAGRDRVEVEGLIALLVNTHALRSDLSGDPTFRELLKRVREVVLGAYEHQELPCEVLVQTLSGNRTTVGHPLFEVVFGWQGASLDRLHWPGVEATRIELDTGTAKFEWTVLVSERQDGSLHLRSEYSTDLFEPETMSRLMDQFLVLLGNVAAEPNRRLSELPVITEAERHKLLVGYNHTDTDYERDSCIHELFEAHARRNPDAVALSFAGQEMTYGSLNGRANQLARHLQACGVTPGTKVGICLERSWEMIVGILAILKAGGAYVPLDRAYPSERLSLMLADSGCAVLVTDSAWFSKQQGLPTVAHVICLDREQPRLAAQSQENLPKTISPTALAYVMYTSGSTGRPKGVLVPHRAVLRLVRNTNYLKFSDELVFLQLAPIAFDASTFEIWGALLNGARLVIYPPQVPSLQELGQTIRDSGITTLWLTAGLFHQMVDDQLETLRGLKHLLAGGDVLSPAHVAKASRELSGCQLINGYGPTENTTFTCCYTVPAGWPEGLAVPIGHPISNTRAYVLDQHRAPVPVAIPGELYTSGDGLADGYLNQPELTATRFVPNPFSKDCQSRLYRTGDIVRWLPDGNIEFLCRNDGQLKIRGYRVETGEVETALARHPGVQATATVARVDNSGTNQLFAYVVPQPGQNVVESDLREFLASKLPPYLVPARILTVSALPLTANGKIDRKALPEPLKDSVQPDPNLQVPPRTPLEETLCDIWCEVLGRRSVGVHEDFFQLGGHSLLATQVISRVGKRCLVELPVVAIFEAPTIARLAPIIDRTRQEQPVSTALVIQRAGPGRASELLDRLGEFSEAELDELLRDPELKNL